MHSSRLEQIWRDVAVLADGREVVDYLGTCILAGLFLIPATRHLFIHLNEAMRVKDLLHRRERKVQ